MFRIQTSVAELCAHPRPPASGLLYLAGQTWHSRHFQTLFTTGERLSQPLSSPTISTSPMSSVRLGIFDTFKHYLSIGERLSWPTPLRLPLPLRPRRAADLAISTLPALKREVAGFSPSPPSLPSPPISPALPPARLTSRLTTLRPFSSLYIMIDAYVTRSVTSCE